jgi:methionyl-tRNA synthetase
MKKSAYFTTPLYYVNDVPHLGSAYTTTLVDVLAKYHKMFGNDVLFLTGTDEHGQKVEQAAAKRGLSPQQHCDEISAKFAQAWTALGIDFDIFFRTTAEFHKLAVQNILQKLYDTGDIYSATYKGWYCVSEEIFYTEKELLNGKTPTGKDVVEIEEKNYFFKMSKYQARLISHIENNPTFILPVSRKNEVLGFLRQPLADLCISRPKSRLRWGIEIPFDRDYVTYVWFDALLNYATGVGLVQETKKSDFEKWWQGAGATHFIGKDILITHSVYWPTMLMAIGVNLPKTIFAHGWILNKENEKMSKSTGSVMSPTDVTAWIGLDSLRYYLVRDFPLGQDAPVSSDLISSRINSDLANNFGNLVSRTTNLIDKFFGGNIPVKLFDDESTQNLKRHALKLPSTITAAIDAYAPHAAVEATMALLTETNKYLEDKAPWKTAKTDLDSCGKALFAALEVIRFAAIALRPILQIKAQTVLECIGHPNGKWQDLTQFGEIAPPNRVQKSPPLFPRIETTFGASL